MNRYHGLLGPQNGSDLPSALGLVCGFLPQRGTSQIYNVFLCKKYPERGVEPPFCNFFDQKTGIVWSKIQSLALFSLFLSLFGRFLSLFVPFLTLFDAETPSSALLGENFVKEHHIYLGPLYYAMENIEEWTRLATV